LIFFTGLPCEMPLSFYFTGDSPKGKSSISTVVFSARPPRLSGLRNGGQARPEPL